MALATIGFEYPPFLRSRLVPRHAAPDIPAPAMAAYDTDSVKRRHVALHPALNSRLPPAVLAFAQERDIVHVERMAVGASEHAFRFGIGR